MNNLKELLKSFIVFVLCLVGICYLVSLAQLEEVKKQELITSLTELF